MSDSAVDNGVLTRLSVSQVSRFDHAQVGGCQRAWWFERAMDLIPDEDDAQSDGKHGHALLEEYLRTGEMPPKRVKMAKAVTGAIVKGELPLPGSDLLIERRFSGQAQKDEAGDWIPLDVETTLWLGGVPWDGFIDVAFRRGPIPEIWDHKFSSDIRSFAKRPSQLIKTVQMPVYVLAMHRQWTDAEQWRLVHHNVSRKGVDSFLASVTVHIDEVMARKQDIEKTVEQMKLVAGATNQNDVRANTKSCDAWQGCPHQSICSAFKEKSKVSLSDDEAAMFGELAELVDVNDTTCAQVLPPDAPPSQPDKIVEVAPVVSKPVEELTLFAPVETTVETTVETGPQDIEARAQALAQEMFLTKTLMERENKQPPATTIELGPKTLEVLKELIYQLAWRDK